MSRGPTLPAANRQDLRNQQGGIFPEYLCPSIFLIKFYTEAGSLRMYCLFLPPAAGLRHSGGSARALNIVSDVVGDHGIAWLLASWGLSIITAETCDPGMPDCCPACVMGKGLPLKIPESMETHKQKKR